MAVASKRASPPTHPSVWIGLGLAGVGLLLAMYAYTGTRVYDITYALVALVGGVLALAGILTAAWGRAIMASRVTRARRQTMTRDALKLADESIAPLPTVAEPASKRKFAFPAPRKLLGRVGSNGADKAESPANRAALFAFKPRGGAAPEPGASGDTVSALAEPAGATPERLKLKCPQCGTEFAAEGVRPLTATCPACGFSAQV